MIPNARRRAFTFVELVAAIFILGICIVPATQYLTASLTLRRGFERDRILTTLAIQTIETEMARVYGAFEIGTETGTFAASGFPDFAYQITRTDASAQGGIPGLLATISVQVWSDDDNDSVLDASEADVAFYTKVAWSFESCF